MIGIAKGHVVDSHPAFRFVGLGGRNLLVSGF